MAQPLWRTPLLIFSLLVIDLITMVSYGLTGKSLMYLTETYDPDTIANLESVHSVYPNSLRALITYNIFLTIYLPCYVYCKFYIKKKLVAYSLGKNKHSIVAGFYILCIWLLRWIIAVTFLEGDNALYA